MIREAGIQLTELEPEAPDLPFGLGSGAAVIYGTSGGVAEAVIRCCTPDKSKNALRTIEHTAASAARTLSALPRSRSTAAGTRRHRPRTRQRREAARSDPERRGAGGPRRGHVLPHRLRRRRGPALRPDGEKSSSARRGSTRSTAAPCSSAASATRSSTRCTQTVSPTARTSCCTSSTRTEEGARWRSRAAARTA